MFFVPTTVHGKPYVPDSMSVLLHHQAMPEEATMTRPHHLRTNEKQRKWREDAALGGASTPCGRVCLCVDRSGSCSLTPAAAGAGLERQEAERV